MPFPTLAARGNHAYKSEMLRLGGSEPEFKGYYMTDTAGKRRWRSEKKAAKETEERPPRRSRKARRQKQESKRSGRKSIGCVSPHWASHIQKTTFLKKWSTAHFPRKHFSALLCVCVCVCTFEFIEYSEFCLERKKTTNLNSPNLRIMRSWVKKKKQHRKHHVNVINVATQVTEISDTEFLSFSSGQLVLN